MTRALLVFACASLAAHASIARVSYANGSSVYGSVADVDIPIRIERGTGVVGIQGFQSPAAHCRLGFRVRRQANGPFRIVVVGPAGINVWSYSGDRDTSEWIWSDTIERYGTIVVTSEVGNNSLLISLCKRADEGPRVSPRTLFQHKLEPLNGQPAATVALGAIVVLLDVVEGGTWRRCTGFVVGSKYVVTNEHCVREGMVLQAIDVYVGYNGETSQRKLKITSVKSNHALDIAVCQLLESTAPSTKLQRGAAVDLRDHLLLIGHPDGGAKMVSRAGCGATSLFISGASDDAAHPTDFAHTCDTIPGSSGSPVFDSMGNVVGVHHLGDDDVAKVQVNRAVRVNEVVGWLQRCWPQAATDIVSGQSGESSAQPCY